MAAVSPCFLLFDFELNYQLNTMNELTANKNFLHVVYVFNLIPDLKLGKDGKCKKVIISKYSF